MAFPTFTWPDWKKYPRGTWFRNIRTGRTGVLIGPAKSSRNGAIVKWDEQPFPVRSVDGEEGHVYFVGIARDAEPVRFTAWNLVGFDGSLGSIYLPDGSVPPVYDDHGLIAYPAAQVRIKGGRALYEAVIHNDETARSNNVKLARVDNGFRGLRETARYVGPDTELEVIIDGV